MSGNRKRVGILGGTGFTGGELIRLLVNHPYVDIAWVYSRGHAGEEISEVHRDLEGVFSSQFTGECTWNVDAVFLCLPHETARNFVEGAGIPADVMIIDLSRDYRLNPEKNGFVYGLPELNKESIRKTRKLANPGCFATAIQLALLPLAQKKALTTAVHVTGITGSTGAGKSLSATTHFTWRNSNASVYKVLKHQHVGEIRQSVHKLQTNFHEKLNFVPMRGNFSRGILASVYTDTEWSQEEALGIYSAFYEGHPFVHVTDKSVDMKQVVGTNQCRISVIVVDGQVHLTSVIDNLIKGASGQAVQNFNLMCRFPEQAGLHLKSIAY